MAPYYRSRPNPSAAPIMHQLELLDIRPRIAVRVESYLAVPHFVAGTDRIALMQERLAAQLAGRMDLRVLFHDRGQFWGLFAQNCPRSWSAPGRPSPRWAAALSPLGGVRAGGCEM